MSKIDLDKITGIQPKDPEKYFCYCHCQKGMYRRMNDVLSMRGELPKTHCPDCKAGRVYGRGVMYFINKKIEWDGKEGPLEEKTFIDNVVVSLDNDQDEMADTVQQE